MSASTVRPSSMVVRHATSEGGIKALKIRCLNEFKDYYKTLSPGDRKICLAAVALVHKEVNGSHHQEKFLHSMPQETSPEIERFLNIRKGTNLIRTYTDQKGVVVYCSVKNYLEIICTHSDAPNSVSRVLGNLFHTKSPSSEERYSGTAQRLLDFMKEEDLKPTLETATPLSSNDNVVVVKDAVDRPLMLIDNHWKSVSGRNALPAGTHNIVLQHGPNKGQTTIIKTNFPFFFFNNVELGRMTRPAHCVVMDNRDFQLIKSTIHDGAFGRDYCNIEPNLVVVWKHPADLLHIEGYNPDPVPVDVGTYGFIDDTGGNHNLAPIQANATKLRTDAKVGTSVVSVHQFVGTRDDGAEFNFPGISTGSFFNDFNNTTPEEIAKVTSLIDELRSYGIEAFMSNATHHAVIIYAMDGQLLTPELLATRLNQDPRILGAISKAAGKDMTPWQSVFIKVFSE